MQISDIRPIDLQKKKQLPILKIVGGVIRTIRALCYPIKLRVKTRLRLNELVQLYFFQLCVFRLKPSTCE